MVHKLIRLERFNDVLQLENECLINEVKCPKENKFSEIIIVLNVIHPSPWLFIFSLCDYSVCFGAKSKWESGNLVRKIAPRKSQKIQTKFYKLINAPKLVMKDLLENYHGFIQGKSHAFFFHHSSHHCYNYHYRYRYSLYCSNYLVITAYQMMATDNISLFCHCNRSSTIIISSDWSLSSAVFWLLSLSPTWLSNIAVVRFYQIIWSAVLLPELLHSDNFNYITGRHVQFIP